MKRNLSPIDYSEFYRGVVAAHGDGCWACRTLPADRWKCLDRSAGRLDAHHLIPQRVVKRHVRPELVRAALTDPRNGVPLARYHHDCAEAGVIAVDVPDACRRFADEYGLTWWLDAQASKREAA